MRYKIKFFIGEKLQRTTTTKFSSWNNAQWFLLKVLKYQEKDNTYIKHDLRAEIVGENGIPF
jgi:hypothetical protein